MVYALKDTHQRESPEWVFESMSTPRFTAASHHDYSHITDMNHEQVGYALVGTRRSASVFRDMEELKRRLGFDEHNG